MLVYFSGIGGVGIGPLAEIAHDAGYSVAGSDLHESLMTTQLRELGIEVAIGQDATKMAEIHEKTPIDWFVYTAALPLDHPELRFARENSIKSGKRDQFLSHLLKDKQLQLIAVAGTHGKTTTTGMLVWAFQQLGIPVSYSVGTTLSFAKSGHYEPNSQYFVYECDEYDRNMLQYNPEVAIITSLGYDHPDTYKDEHVYKNAFVQFMTQSNHTFLWQKDLRYLAQPDIAASYEAYDELMDLSHLQLAGDHTRHNAFLVERVLRKLFPDINHETIVDSINSFPGTARRFEELGDNLCSDYGHHPAEIAATLQMASELSGHIVLVYQPHQNIRQHLVRDQYAESMVLAKEIYWLPTYLSREDPSLEILSPQELISGLVNKDVAKTAEMNDGLWDTIEKARQEGKLVICMGAGDIDEWIRQKL